MGVILRWPICSCCAPYQVLVGEGSSIGCILLLLFLHLESGCQSQNDIHGGVGARAFGGTVFRFALAMCAPCALEDVLVMYLSTLVALCSVGPWLSQ